MKVGKQTIVFKNRPKVIGYYSMAGEKEVYGNFKDYFDYILKDDKFGEKTFEKAERKIIEHTIFKAIDKSNLSVPDIDLLISGDLLNQIISSSFSAKHFDSPFIGLYGACSTMAESLAIGACLVDSKNFNNVACCTGSHFSTVERQYRFPLELGNQRPPVSQWTVTGAGCSILSLKGKGNVITAATFGKVTDYDVKDVNNMGAAMAPAAMRTIISHFEDMQTTPDDYDLILTGDLGKLGSEIFMDLMEHNGYKLGNNYNDCGQMMYNINQKSYQGGSGTGCSAIVLNSYVYKKLSEGKFKKVLFAATGALLSPLSSQQGESIPSICHVVVIERGEE